MSGNTLGYSTHNRKLKEALIGEGVEITITAEDAFTLVTPDKYRPIAGKKNWLETMWECEDLPQVFIDGMARADEIVAPCNHNRDLFRRYTDKPVHTCWEGVDVERFTYRPRRLSSFPIKVLWVGAPNPRKGFQNMLHVWTPFMGNPDWLLYMKTTPDPWANTEPKLERKSNIIFDSRLLPIEELVGLYHDANIFVLPSWGEGFGLTLAEAMATGLPCIASAVTGTKDFFDNEVGYVVRTNKRKIHLTNWDVETSCSVPDNEHLADLIIKVALEYNKALKKGRRAARWIRQCFTWKRSAQRLIKIIRGEEGGSQTAVRLV